MPQEHCSPPLPQAHKFSRAARKWLQHGFEVSVHHPNLPRSLQIVHFRGLWGWGRSPRYPEPPWQCSSRWAAQGSRELRGVGDGFTKSVQSQLPHQSHQRRALDHPTETLLEHSTASLRPAGPEELPKRHCHAGLGSLPSTECFLAAEARPQPGFCGVGPAAQLSGVSQTLQHQLCEGRGPRTSPRWWARLGPTRPMWSQTWPFGGGLNREEMVTPCKLHMCQDPHRDNNGCCLSILFPMPHNSVFPARL